MTTSSLRVGRSHVGALTLSSTKFEQQTGIPHVPVGDTQVTLIVGVRTFGQ